MVGQTSRVASLGSKLTVYRFLTFPKNEFFFLVIVTHKSNR